MLVVDNTRGKLVPLLALTCALFWVAFSPPRVAGKEKAFTSEQVRFFDKEVKPLLETHCFRCHGGEKKVRGGLRLTSRQGVLTGGDLGPAVSLSKPEESLLLQAISYKDVLLQMPPKGKLADAQIEILSRWVKSGLPWSPGATTTVKSPPNKGSAITEKDRNYWAYRPLERPEVPAVKNRAWVSTPVDAFLLARLEEKGIPPAPPADRVALIRRVYYDLIGLPPTPEEVDAFVADTRPDAYEQLVDRLLASPQYGEKWGRHWLDLVRYGETNGYERDGPKPNVWRYRDYIIRSFNADKPYDRFIVEQLAGDELPDRDRDSIIATGYYRLGLWQDEPVDALQSYFNQLDDIVSTTSQAFLGSTLGCARCHNHKRDPLLQKDYYSFLAFFRGIEPYSKDRNVSSPFNQTDISDLARQGNSGARGQEFALSVNHCQVNPPPTHVLIRGNAHAPGEKVEPSFPVVLHRGEVKIPPPPKGASSAGRRIVLAKWIASKDNPLTARVLVNRLWQYHFGRGIVPTANDFGKLGEPPTNPELLNWLAAEFLAGDWQIKRIHRLLLLSRAYQMSSRAHQEGLSKDPGNYLLWRFNMRRLTAEELRDAVLATSGQLNRKMAGPSIYPPISQEVLAGQSRPGSGWPTSSPQESARRSVYVHVKRSLLVPILEVHDLADTDSSCALRYTTTVPTQSLEMLNGNFANEQARTFAKRLRQEVPGNLEGQIRRAIRLTTGRTPGQEEVQADLAFVRDLRTQDKLSEERALTLYCLLALNTNEFVYLD
jgi:hypothetical protein